MEIVLFFQRYLLSFFASPGSVNQGNREAQHILKNVSLNISGGPSSGTWQSV